MSNAKTATYIEESTVFCKVTDFFRYAHLNDRSISLSLAKFNLKGLLFINCVYPMLDSKLQVIKAKLKALQNDISFRLRDPMAHYFDPPTVLDLFQRYVSISNTLRSEHPSLFGDLPVREVPKSSGSTDYGGRGYIESSSLELLFSDVSYCVDLLINIGFTMPEAPSMKLTREGVFFAGQYFDALQRVREILSNANQSIAIIDAYINEDVLNLVTSKHPGVEVKILTKAVSPALRTAADAFNRQYGGLSIRISEAFHDRFVVIDYRDFYHFGASIKDLGNRGFMFSRIEEPDVINALSTKWAQVWRQAEVVV